MTKEIYTGYNIENLQKLRDAVERHGPEHFSMAHWFRKKPLHDGHRPERHDLNGGKDIDINECGTTACLAGHAALLMREEAVIGTPEDWLGLASSGLFFTNKWGSVEGVEQAGSRIQERVFIAFSDSRNYAQMEYAGALEMLDAVIEHAKNVQEVKCKNE